MIGVTISSCLRWNALWREIDRHEIFNCSVSSDSSSPTYVSCACVCKEYLSYLSTLSTLLAYIAYR